MSTAQSENAPRSENAPVWPCFEIYRDAAGLFRWRLRDATGHVLAASRSYETRPECLEGVEAVRGLAPKAPVVEEETPGATAPPFAAS